MVVPKNIASKPSRLTHYERIRTPVVFKISEVDVSVVFEKVSIIVVGRIVE